jgi:hypothetical protein
MSIPLLSSEAKPNEIGIRDSESYKLAEEHGGLGVEKEPLGTYELQRWSKTAAVQTILARDRDHVPSLHVVLFPHGQVNLVS